MVGHLILSWWEGDWVAFRGKAFLCPPSLQLERKRKKIREGRGTKGERKVGGRILVIYPIAPRGGQRSGGVAAEPRFSPPFVGTLYQTPSIAAYQPTRNVLSSLSFEAPCSSWIIKPPSSASLSPFSLLTNWLMGMGCSEMPIFFDANNGIASPSTSFSLDEPSVEATSRQERSAGGNPENVFGRLVFQWSAVETRLIRGFLGPESDLHRKGVVWDSARHQVTRSRAPPS